MHVYLPEKYRSPFLHGVFLFSKVGVLVVNFDGFFALAYSSHLLWSWSLGKTWYHHTSLSSALCLKGCQLCPTFFRKGIMEPTQSYFFYLPPSLIMPPSVQFGFGDEAMWRKVWQGVVFMQKILEFQSYSKHRNHFNIDSEQTHSEEIQVIPMKRFSEVMKTFCFAFDENMKNTKWHLVGHKRFKFQFEGYWEPFFQSIYFICMNNDLVRMRKHCLPIQIACPWSERAWLGT